MLQTKEANFKSEYNSNITLILIDMTLFSAFIYIINMHINIYCKWDLSKFVLFLDICNVNIMTLMSFTSGLNIVSCDFPWEDILIILKSTSELHMYFHSKKRDILCLYSIHSLEPYVSNHYIVRRISNHYIVRKYNYGVNKY
jgi:hypothetical protein